MGSAGTNDRPGSLGVAGDSDPASSSAVEEVWVCRGSRSSWSECPLSIRITSFKGDRVAAVLTEVVEVARRTSMDSAKRTTLLLLLLLSMGSIVY